MRQTESSKNYVFGHTASPAIFNAFAEMAKERLAGKEYTKQRPKTAMRFEINDWYILTFKPEILSSPTGWKIGNKIRLELRQSVKVWGVKGNGCVLILELNPDGSITPRRWKKDIEKTKEFFDVVKEYLDLFANNPELAISKNTFHCAICGKGFTDPESMARGVGPECVKGFNMLVNYINGESEIV